MNHKSNRFPENCTQLSRRRLLRLLTKSSGITLATAILPVTWSKPVIEIGYLPVHAQGSPTPTPTTTAQAAPTIEGVTRALTSLNDCRGPDGSTGSVYTIRFAYRSSAQAIQTGTRVRHMSRFSPSGRQSGFETSNISIIGDGSTGTISYTICTGFGADDEITTTVVLIDGAGRESNALSLTQNRPVGANSASDRSYEIQ